jgi:DNA-binding GntR family transcriptional regulator
MPPRDGVAVSRTVEEIRYRIVTGSLNPGEAVRQEDMAQELNLSRAPIREALRVLTDQGLLEHRVHTGYFVKKRSTSELRQIYLMLEFLETHVMATIEEPETTAIVRMQAINDEMRRYVESDDWSPMIDLNRRFHFEIFRLSPLLVVLEELERLWTIAAPYIAQKYVTVEMRTRTVSEHDGLIASLEPFDRERTAALLETHRMQRAFGG